MDMIEKLPAMTDDDLGTLIVNAKRLVQTGTAKQRQAAEAMLPTIQAEATRRHELKPAKSAARGGRKRAVAADAT